MYAMPAFWYQLYFWIIMLESPYAVLYTMLDWNIISIRVIIFALGHAINLTNGLNSITCAFYKDGFDIK